jgi:hypothetical protein
MKQYLGAEIAYAPAGYYWFRSPGNVQPLILRVSQKATRTDLDFDYPNSTYVRRGAEMDEDLLALSYFGPIEVPNF